MDQHLRELKSMLDPKEFDIWGLIRRSNQTDPYILMAKHRMNKTTLRKTKTATRLIGRRRRRTSLAESTSGESIRSHTSTELYDPDHLGDDYDFDADDDVHDPDALSDHSQEMYRRACAEYNVHPVAYFYKALQTEKCILRHRQLGPDGIKAIAIALVGNSIIANLDLADNNMGPKGAEYIADCLRENTFVTSLSLADNDIRVQGVKTIVDVILKNDGINSLDLSGNGIRECDAAVIRPLIEDTANLKHLNLSHNQLREAGGEVIGEALLWNDTVESLDDTANLKHLNLSHNQLREAGGEVIGEALLWNDTMESLDLSWNHLRRDGAVFVAEGLAENSCLKKLNLAWNGFYMDGCRAIAKALEENKTLTELDLTCNRISKDCLDKLMGGLKKNSTLETLRLGWNPITPQGAMDLLEFIKNSPVTGIKELDLTDQLVEPAFVALIGEIEARKEINVIYGQVRGQLNRGDDDDEKQLMDENPIIVLMEFGKLMGFRLMDLFAALDKDGSKSLDHQEIRDGLRMVNIPLSDKCIEILINKLDVDGDGEIDFGELMAAQTEHRRKMSKFYAAQEGEIDVEDTEIGRVRIKLSRLMAKKMSGNPAFKRSVQMMQNLLNSGGEAKLAQKLKSSLKRDEPPPVDNDNYNMAYQDKMRTWKPLSTT